MRLTKWYLRENRFHGKIPIPFFAVFRSLRSFVPTPCQQIPPHRRAAGSRSRCKSCPSSASRSSAT
ncbi:hypothetical protein BC2230_60332 [Burkholderia cepacia]